MSKRTLHAMNCNDCGADVVALGDYYMADDKVWEDELGLGWNDNLCIGCLETRLGRQIKIWDDFTPAQIPGALSGDPIPVKLSPRLLDRMGMELRRGKWRPKKTVA